MPPTRSHLLPHLVASATGAANDNLFRMVFTVALAGWGSRHGMSDEASNQTGTQLILVAGLVYLVPFALFASLAGSLGDRIAKHHIARAVRWCEIPLVVLGVIGFSTDSLALMFASLAGLSIQSAFFSPVKLALVPELVPPERVAKANGLLQAVTIVAILGGTAAAAVADKNLGIGLSPAVALACAALLIAITGCVAAAFYPRLTPGDPLAPLRPFALLVPIKSLRSGPGLIPPALSLGGFWGLAAAAQLMVIATGEQIYGLDQGQTALLALTLSGGIIVGSLLAPRLESLAFPAGLPLIGATLASTTLALAGGAAATGSLPVVGFGTALFFTGIGAGLWEVPLQVLLMRRAPENHRNQVMAGSGFIGTLFMLGATGLCLPLSSLLGLSPASILSVLGWATLACVCGFAVHYRHQLGAWLITRFVRLLYHVRVTGADLLPSSGGCLVVCNHLTFADGLILGACLPRPARYVVYRRYVDMPVIGAILRLAGAIPVDAEDNRRALLASIDAAVAAAKAGAVVVIFPEGKLTRSGQMDSFKSGMERIARRAGVPVVPAHLDGLWGSALSRAPRRGLPIPLRPVSLRLGPPMDSQTPSHHARDQVSRLGNLQAQARSDRDGRTLGTALIRQAKAHPHHIAVQDLTGTISTLQLAAMARALIPLLELAKDEERVGILLPPGRGGAIVNAALAIAGRTAVNLNHTVGPVQLAQLCAFADLRTVITANAYLKRIGDQGLGQRLVPIDDLLPRVAKVTIIRQIALILTLPARWLAERRPGKVAAIIFSSGSTGVPKGIELTHRQILANCDSVADALHLEPGKDVILSPLPLFHSFGLIPGFWLGLVLGVRVACHPDPTDAKGLGRLAEAAGGTFLLATPTFARGYLRRVEPTQFSRLRFAVVGAERCPEDLKKQFKEHFGADLLEGYGCTELAPVATVNLPEVRRDGVREIRIRDGSVGRPLPGIHVTTIDPATHGPLPPGTEGLLVVHSPARMRGYLKREDLTEAAFLDGGYNTGDIGHVDADGFVFITGRLARFAKIGGEMVPLDHVEATLQAAVGDDHEVAVAAVPDPAKGERLMVLHNGEQPVIEAALGALDSLPSLWRPKSSDAFRVDAIPKLGTGKRDLGSLKRMAEELVAARSSKPAS